MIPSTLSPHGLPLGSAEPFLAPSAAPALLRAQWAQDPSLIEAAQALRHTVFAKEMGAQLPEVRNASGVLLDVDRFDPYCEHLVITAERAGESAPEVIGTYRVLLPDAARRAGGYYTETEFDCSALTVDRRRLAELGRSCVAAPYRTGPVIRMLWAALLQFLVDNGIRYAIGCTSVSMADGGSHAARLWASLRDECLAPAALQVRPHTPLPVEHWTEEGPVEIPTLVRGYLKCGAHIMGPPAWDPDFAVADLPMVLDLDQLTASHRRRLLGQRCA